MCRKKGIVLSIIMIGLLVFLIFTSINSAIRLYDFFYTSNCATNYRTVIKKNPESLYCFKDKERTYGKLSEIKQMRILRKSDFPTSEMFQMEFCLIVSFLTTQTVTIYFDIFQEALEYQELLQQLREKLVESNK